MIGVDVVEVEGVVVELLPKGLYRVELDTRHRILAHPSVGPRRNFVRLVKGDRVRVELAPHDRGRGRITHRVE